jgi:hypothetical protein
MLATEIREVFADLMEFPSDQIVEEFRRALVVSALALSLDFEIIERFWAARLAGASSISTLSP